MEERIVEASAEIIQLARSTLFVEFSFMQRAVSAISTEACCDDEALQGLLFACDGSTLYYSPLYVALRYRDERNIINRSLLHSILHCVFRHGWVGPGIDREIWDLSADIAVEHTISVMNSDSLYVSGQAQQSPVIGEIECGIPVMNAENIYRHFIEKIASAPDGDDMRRKVLSLRERFMMDQHALWYRGDAKSEEAEALIRQWRDVSKRMQVELETMSSGQDTLCAKLHSVNRTKKSYAEFMRHFGRRGEVMRLSDDEFDIGYYSYGLELYGNIPLIEQLEYREQKKIREFVIAIDTSGSVQGDTVRSFIQRSYELLKSREAFDIDMRIRIIQCDDRVREEALITSDAELEKYMDDMTILGLGRTDFRPVFDHVAHLLRERRIRSLDGLLYFTDGAGIFPKEKPPYDVAFIIRSDEVYPPEVPRWAMRLVLEEDMR